MAKESDVELKTRTKVIIGIAIGVALFVAGLVIGISVGANNSGVFVGAGAAASGGLLAGLAVRGKGSNGKGVGADPAVVHDKLQADLDKALAGRQESAARLQQLGDILIGLRADLDEARQQLTEAQRRYGILESENGKLRDSIRASQQSGSDLDKLIGGQG